MEFRTIFDVKTLGDNELGHLEFVVNSPSYSQVFEPYLRRTRDSLNTMLLMPTWERKSNYPDDYIRGGIVVVDGLLNFFKQLIEETQIERISRAQSSMTESEEYQYRKEQGQLQPVVGLKQEEISTDPEEDY